MSSLPLMIIDTQQAISSGLWIGIQTQESYAAATCHAQFTEVEQNLGNGAAKEGGPHTQNASVRRCHLQNRQGVRQANEGTQRPSQLYSTAKSEAWIFFFLGGGREFFPYHQDVLWTWKLCVARRKEKSLKRTIYRKDKDRERNQWMWGGERRGVPFSSLKTHWAFGGT